MPTFCLMIMNARAIPECISSFKSLKGIDKAWFRGFTELQLENEISKFISLTNYDYYVINSDDTIVTQENISLIKNNANPNCMVSGWVKMSMSSGRASIQLKDTRLRYLMFIVAWTYGKFCPNNIKRLLLNFAKDTTVIKASDVEKLPDVFRVYFHGMAFGCMSREMWIKYPFRVYHSRLSWVEKSGSDINICERLNRNNIPMYVIKKCYIVHLRSMQSFLVGKVKPSVILEKEEK